MALQQERSTTRPSVPFRSVIERGPALCNCPISSVTTASYFLFARWPDLPVLYSLVSAASLLASLLLPKAPSSVSLLGRATAS